METDKHSYTGEFLKQFPVKSRSLIANQFRNAFLDGRTDVDSLIKVVVSDVKRQILDKREYDYIREQKPIQRQLYKALYTDPEAKLYAQHVISYQSLPQKIRDEVRRKNSEKYRNAWYERNKQTSSEQA